MKLRSSEVDKIQNEWKNKPCNHDRGYGHEIDDETGCDCDCFCLQCGMRYASAEFFEQRKKSEK